MIDETIDKLNELQTLFMQLQPKYQRYLLQTARDVLVLQAKCEKRVDLQEVHTNA